MSDALRLTALPGLPLVQAGDDLAALLADALTRADLSPRPGDVLALAQKVVSKAEGRSVPLASVTPSAAAWRRRFSSPVALSSVSQSTARGRRCRISSQAPKTDPVPLSRAILPSMQSSTKLMWKTSAPASSQG